VNEAEAAALVYGLQVAPILEWENLVAGTDCSSTNC